MSAEERQMKERTVLTCTVLYIARPIVGVWHRSPLWPKSNHHTVSENIIRDMFWHGCFNGFEQKRWHHYIFQHHFVSIVKRRLSHQKLQQYCSRCKVNHHIFHSRIHNCCHRRRLISCRDGNILSYSFCNIIAPSENHFGCLIILFLFPSNRYLFITRWFNTSFIHSYRRACVFLLCQPKKFSRMHFGIVNSQCVRRWHRRLLFVMIGDDRGKWMRVDHR